MGNYTREEILQMVEEEDVEFIRLQFTDMFGAIKNIAVTTRELPRASGAGYVCYPAVASAAGKSCENDLQSLLAGWYTIQKQPEIYS